MTMTILTRPALRIVDSITELSDSDQGCIAVSGSHGGLSSGRYAIAARPLLSVFNDAGVGKNQAGIAALTTLQEEGLAACAVSHSSACIGQADSTLRYGIVSHINPLAAALGCAPGMSVLACVERLGGAIPDRSRSG